MKTDAATVDLAVSIAAELAARIERNFHIMPTLTLAQAAEALGVSDETMRKLCNEGKIPFIRMDRLYRIKPADINAYLEENYQCKNRKETGHEANDHH